MNVKGMMRHGALLLLLALLLNAQALAAEPEKISEFKDIPAGHWADESVARAVDLGLVQGLGNKKFGLGTEITGAQYATLLCRLMGWELISPEQGSIPSNQDPTAWYFRAVETALVHEALTPGGGFDPNGPVTREDLASMTVRALGWSSLAGLVQDDCPYKDVTVNRGYITLANRMGFLFGTGSGKFSPKDHCTREQAAAVLLRLYDRLHAELKRGADGELPEGVALVIIPAQTGMETPVPFSPRASLEAIYAASRTVGRGGSVALHTAPFAQTVKNGLVYDGRSLTAEEFNALSASENAQLNRSARYGSSYLLLPAEDGDTVVWFASEDDLEAAAELCRLLGLGGMYTIP